MPGTGQGKIEGYNGAMMGSEKKLQATPDEQRTISWNKYVPVIISEEDI
jgi:hypothetical protein